MNSSLYHLTTTQFKEFLREPEALFWALAFPILLAWLLGIAFVGQGAMVRSIGVIETTPAAPAVRAWEAGLAPANRPVPGPGTQAAATPQPAVSARFKFVPEPSATDALLAIKRGKFGLYVDADALGVRFHFDPNYSDAVLDYLLLKHAAEKPGFASSDRVVPLRTVGSRYIDFLIPGLISLGILNSAIWGMGWGLIERRMKKLLRRMVASPMPKYQYLLSFFFSRLVLSAFEVSVLFAFAILYFKVQVTGSWAAFAALFLAGNLAFGGIAVLTGSRAHDSQVGNGLINAVTIPMMLLSGIFFSYYHFPEWMITVVRLLPLTILADALRQVFTEGAGLDAVAIPLAALLAYGLGAFFLGLRIFKWY